jgi:hypothetical protein
MRCIDSVNFFKLSRILPYFFVLVLYSCGTREGEIDEYKYNFRPCETVISSDSIFQDYDWFNLQPVCPIRNGEASYPRLQVWEDSSFVKIVAFESSSFTRSPITLTKERDFAFSITRDRGKSASSIKYLTLFIAKQEYIAEFTYFEQPSHIVLLSVDIMFPDFSIVKLYVDKRGKASLGEWPSRSEIMLATKESFEFDKSETRINLVCLLGNCESYSPQSVWYHKNQENPHVWVYWHWLFRDYFAFDSPEK